MIAWLTSAAGKVVLGAAGAVVVLFLVYQQGRSAERAEWEALSLGARIAAIETEAAAADAVAAAERASAEMMAAELERSETLIAELRASADQCPLTEDQVRSLCGIVPEACS